MTLLLLFERKSIKIHSFISTASWCVVNTSTVTHKHTYNNNSLSTGDIWWRLPYLFRHHISLLIYRVIPPKVSTLKKKLAEKKKELQLLTEKLEAAVTLDVDSDVEELCTPRMRTISQSELA